jgi:hypothetical protein
MEFMSMGKKLKNWFVRFETIKGGANGLINMADYILDDNHTNHQKNNHYIIAYETASQTILKNMLSIQQNKDNEVLLNRKGGRPASFGKSLIVSFPSEIKLSDENYKSIRDSLIIDLIKFISEENDLNYTNEQIEYFKRNFILSSLHKQPNNDHINIIVPNVLLDLNDNKKLKRIDLGKKRYSSFLKTLTNKLLLKYGHNYLEYQIKSQRNNRNRKNKLHYATQQLQEQLEKQELHLNEKVEKIQTRIGHYFNRMETAITENDKPKFDKNLEYVKSNLDKLKKVIGSNEEEDDALFKQIADIKSILGESDFSFDNYPSPKI